MKKIIATVSAAFVLVTAALAFASAPKAGEPSALPTVATVLPDVTPLASHRITEEGSMLVLAKSPGVQTTRPIVVVGTPPAPKVWTCGAPKGLTQGSGTVRSCEWR